MIVTYLVSLGITRGKGVLLLESFPTLVPSIILCMNEVANLFWEDDAFARASGTEYDTYVNVV